MRRSYLAATLILAALVALGAAGCAGGQEPPGEEAGPEEFEIGLIGDFPYDDAQEQQVANLFEELRRFESSENPLVYTPGDNEWTDCHRHLAGAPVPERTKTRGSDGGHRMIYRTIEHAAVLG